MTFATPSLDVRALAVAFENVADGVLFLTPDAGCSLARFRVTAANRAVTRLLRAEAAGRTLCEILPRQHCRRFVLHLRKVVATHTSLDFSTEVALGAGQPQHLHVRLSPVADSDGQTTLIVAVIRVLTETKRIESAFRGLRDRFASAFEYAPYGVAFVGMDRHPLMVNRSFQKCVDRPVVDLSAAPIGQIFDELDRPLFDQALEKVGAGLRTYEGMELRLTRQQADGEPVWVSVSLSLARDGTAPYVILQMTDICERKRGEHQLMQMATSDHLTGIANRLVFDQALGVALANARRYGRQGAVLFVDMDDFKVVNDTFGHKAGDTVLREVANALRRTVRGTDTLARLGGDEFAIILDEVDAARAEHKAQLVRDAISQIRITVKGKQLAVQASVGVKTFDGRNEKTCSADAIVQAADKAMYRQKNTAKARRLAS